MNMYTYILVYQTKNSQRDVTGSKEHLQRPKSIFRQFATAYSPWCPRSESGTRRSFPDVDAALPSISPVTRRPGARRHRFQGRPQLTVPYTEKTQQTFPPATTTHTEKRQTNFSKSRTVVSQNLAIVFQTKTGNECSGDFRRSDGSRFHSVEWFPSFIRVRGKAAEGNGKLSQLLGVTNRLNCAGKGRVRTSFHVN